MRADYCLQPEVENEKEKDEFWDSSHESNVDGDER